MAVRNNLQDTMSAPKFSVMVQGTKYQKLIRDTLGDPEHARRFIASISSAVGVNPALQECEASSILTAALLGEALNLSPSPQLGQYYMVPYKKKDRNGNVVSVKAQFQLGYKGYIQLAIRSGQYLDIDAFPVRQGEFKGRDKSTRKPIFEFSDDYGDGDERPVVGYCTYFELLNGFRKVLYWTKEEMERHADRYSQAFSMENYRKYLAGGIPEKDMWRYSSYWYKSFDDMACKTMLRQLISKWGIMSIEMQRAFENDEAAINEDGTPDFIDISDAKVVSEDATETVDESEPDLQADAPDNGDPLSFSIKNRRKIWAAIFIFTQSR